MNNEEKAKVEKGRWIKNVNTDVVFLYHEKQLKKPHMVECGKDGKILVENLSVADGDMVGVMKGLVDDKRTLKDKCDAQEKELLAMKAKFGTVESALPEVGVKKVKPMTKKEIAEKIFSDFGIAVDPVKKNLPELTAILEECEKNAEDNK